MAQLWADGLWTAGLWADGLWAADGDTPPPAPPPPEEFHGGFFVSFERELARRARERKRREADESAAQQSARDAVEAEIAQLLHEQGAKDAKAQELDRLSSLVAQFADKEAATAYTARVATALARAHAQRTASAMLALDRELRRQLDEEEIATLLALAIQD